MDEGEGTNNERRLTKRQIRSLETITYEKSVMDLSREGRMTNLILNRNRVRPLNSIAGTFATVFDNSSPSYQWLRPGWLAEERRISVTGRLYRYYYDPVGQMYGTRQEVEQIYTDIDKFWDNKDGIVINLD